MIPKFITPCFVHIEDKAYREKVLRELDELGYACACVGYGNDAIVSTHDAGYSVGYRPVQSDTIDCGTNAELFLALAGMRDDTDEGQWFVSHGFKLFDKLKGTVETSTGRKSIMAGEWFKPLIKNIKFKWLGNHEFHQATAQEIVEYFNNKTK